CRADRSYGSLRLVVRTGAELQILEGSLREEVHEAVMGGGSPASKHGGKGVGGGHGPLFGEVGDVVGGERLPDVGDSPQGGGGLGGKRPDGMIRRCAHGILPVDRGHRHDTDGSAAGTAMTSRVRFAQSCFRLLVWSGIRSAVW